MATYAEWRADVQALEDNQAQIQALQDARQTLLENERASRADVYSLAAGLLTGQPAGEYQTTVQGDHYSLTWDGEKVLDHRLADGVV